MTGLLRKANERLYPARLLFGPEHLVLGVNNFCNLHCKMCDVGTGDSQTNFGANLTGAKTGSMPFALYQRIAGQLSATWPRAHLGFVFTEPLAWQPLGDALAHARKLSLHATVTTNGLLLERRAAEMAMARELFVSLDGPESIHDHIRGKAGSFARAVAGIAAVAAQAQAPAISVFCAITEWNVGHLRTFLRDLASLPLRRVGLMHNNFVTGGQAAAHNRVFGDDFPATASNVFESDPARIDLDLLAEELQAIAGDHHPFAVSIQPHRIARHDLFTYYRQPEVMVGRRCTDASRFLMIDADGEAIPAHGRCFRFPVANIRDHTLAQIWNHARLSQLRRGLQEAGGLMPACSRCCGGFSGAAKPV